MRGRDYLSRRGKKNTEAAIRMFENALEIDREFAAAYAGLGEACAYMYEWYDGSAAWLARAIEMNREALERDPGSVEARFGIAMVYYHQRRFAEAKRTSAGGARSGSATRAGAPAPGHARRAHVAATSQDALAQYQRAAELRPHDDDPWRYLAGAAPQARRRPTRRRTRRSRSSRSRRSKLEASLEDVVLLSRLAEAYARFGGREETHAILRRVLELDPSDGLVLYNCACAHALLGESRRGARCSCAARSTAAFARLRTRRGRTAHSMPIAAHPEFQRLIAELE